MEVITHFEVVSLLLHCHSQMRLNGTLSINPHCNCNITCSGPYITLMLRIKTVNNAFWFSDETFSKFILQ